MKDKILIILILLVLTLSGYMAYDQMSNGYSTNEMKTELKDLRSDYGLIQRDLEASLSSLEISNDIIASQKSKIETLLKKNELTERELAEAKKLMQSISRSVMEEYQLRVHGLQREKELLVQNQKTTDTELALLQEKISNLEVSNKNMSSKYDTERADTDRKLRALENSSALSLSNFTMKSYKVRSSGKEIETDKAYRINRVKVSFDINENPRASSGKKEMFIVVHKPDGQLATFSNASTGSFITGGRQISYSDRFWVNYNKEAKKTVAFEWENSNLKNGNYVIEVFENNVNKIAKIGGAIKKLD